MTFDEIMDQVTEKQLRCRDEQTFMKNVGISDSGGMTMMRDGKVESYPMNDWAVQQLCGKLKIPVDYFRKCPPILKAINVEHWATSKDFLSKELLVRLIEDETKGEHIRGILTPSYSVYNNFRFVETINQVMRAEMGEDVQIESFSDLDNSFHMRVLFPEMKQLVKGADDEVIGGIHFANSEVGFRRVSCDLLVYQQICTNGMVGLVKGNQWFSHIHRGMDDVNMNHVIRNIIKEGAVQLKAIMNELVELSKSEPIPDKDIEKVISIVGNGLPKEFLEGVKIQLLKDADFTKYGLLNAFTSSAKTLEPDERLRVETEVPRRLIKAAA